MSRHSCTDVLESLTDAGVVAITAHVRPDGDALGAALGLQGILRARGIDARVVGLEPVSPRYAFLVDPGGILSVTDNWYAGADAVCVLDCAAEDRCAAPIGSIGKTIPIINIDHHGSNTLFGSVNWVDEHASSTGEMVVRLAREAGWSIPKKAAEALWVAIITDTGRFSYENTNAGVLRIGADLLDLGVDPARVATEVYHSTSIEEVRLVERALGTLDLRQRGKVASVVLRERDFEEFGCGPENAQDIVDIPRSLNGVALGFFFYELTGEGITKVSARSVAPYDVSELCKLFGGGGHRRAAGCSLEGAAPEVMERVLARVHEMWFT